MAFKLEDYKVGWITALPIEAAAAKAMLDTIHPRLATPEYDSNIYTFGYINPGHGVSNGGHNVIIASGRPGTATAATVANDMRRTFTWLRIGLMVGIAGGVWSPDTDVRLGDIVVGVHPSGEAGVIQYDYGKQIQDKDFLKTTAMNKAPAILLNAVAAVQADHIGLEPPEMAYVSHLDREQARRFSKRPTQDRLFNATYLHQAGSCDKCDERQLCDRPTREHLTIPQIHYGPIASGNRVIRDAVFAEKVRMKYGNLCFEMEAAGLDNFPSLTIRGISDYCDTHKNDDWHQYAAIAAAAYAKELLSVVPPTAIVQLPQLGNTYWSVPRAPNPLFTGRESLLEDMKKHLVTREQKNDRPVFVLQGIGGAGKSEAAIKFATDNQDNFWGIFWIDADNKQSIEQGFAEIAKMQTPPLKDTTTNDVLRWLANVKESWLLILDNCDDAMMDFAAYMPSRGGSIVLTTRLTECKILGTWANIDDLGRDTATQLLLRTCGYESGNQEAHISAAEAVVSNLGQHALALVHAGAYIKKGLCPLNEYVQFFRKEQARLMKFKPQQQASRYGSVYATFEVSAEALASSQDHDCELALRLLNILAFLHREVVEEDVFSRAFDECHRLENKWRQNGMRCPECPAASSMEYDRIAKGQSELDALEFSEDNTHVACRHRTCLIDIDDDGLPGSYIMNRLLIDSDIDAEDTWDFVFVDSIDHCYNKPSTVPVKAPSNPDSPFISKTPHECAQLLLKLRKDTDSEIIPHYFIIMDERSLQDDTVLLVTAGIDAPVYTVRATFEASAQAIVLYFTGHRGIEEDIDSAAEEEDGVYHGQ
ncbi:purine and uridine phosphorylase, partial [Aureobasidium melanogenum]